MTLPKFKCCCLIVRNDTISVINKSLISCFFNCYVDMSQRADILRAGREFATSIAQRKGSTTPSSGW